MPASARYIAVLLAAAASPGAAAELTDYLSISGLVEGRAAWNDGPPSWEDGGLGKISFGGESRARAHGEAAASVRLDLGWNIAVSANASLDPRRSDNPVDLIDAFAEFESSPARRTRFHARLGAFFPPVSLENTAIAWTSPFTLTSSAINTWIGEEMRTFGAEAGAVHRFDDGHIGVLGAVFAANDPAGVLLAWRGWTISDREAGIFERLPLAPLPLIGASGPIPFQAPWFELAHEIDDRPGVYLGIDGALRDVGEARLMVYDNRARDTAFDGFQYAWRTRFAAAGVRLAAIEDVELIAQAMIGDTSMGTPAPGMSLVNADYASAFVLASRAFGRHRLSARAEYFETVDRDATALDNNGEHGTALTLAYVFRPKERQRLTLELLRAVSYRPERIEIGAPLKASETQVQASYRFFF
jgi:hypothetical protein